MESSSAPTLRNVARTTPFRSRRTMAVALMAALVAGFSKQSAEFKEIRRHGYRHGKHNGRNPGSFGGARAAKAHRRIYLRQREIAALEAHLSGS